MGVQSTPLATSVVLTLTMKAYRFSVYNYPQGADELTWFRLFRYFLTACHFSVTKVTVFTFACKRAIGVFAVRMCMTVVGRIVRAFIKI